MSKGLKILMFGPAYGHNIQPFIEFFENNKQHDLTFAYSGKNDFLNSTKQITYFKFSKNPFALLKLGFLIKNNFDVIWYHGGYDLNLLFLINFFKNRDTKLVINVWGEHVPNIMLANTSEAKKFKKYYQKADLIQCNWYGLQNLLKKNFSEDKLPVLPWGLDSQFLTSEGNIGKDAQHFISKIDKNITNFFYPKSFTEASDHDCIIEAVKILKNKGISNFCVYFWTGNISRGDFENKAEEKIKNENLSELIKIEKHNYLPFADIKAIWEHMDCGLQISIHDQLSSTLLEPMCVKKEVIATKIEPYEILLKKYPELELDLILRTKEVLANRMEDFIDGNRSSQAVLENRKKVIEKEFNFEKNIQKMIDFYQAYLK